MTGSDIEARIRAGLPDGASLEFAEFPSGAIDVLIRKPGGGVVLLQSDAGSTKIGLTPEFDDALAAFNDGHPQIFTDWETAIGALLEAIR